MYVYTSITHNRSCFFLFLLLLFSFYEFRFLYWIRDVTLYGTKKPLFRLTSKVDRFSEWNQ